MNWRPVVVCSVLAVPCIAGAAALNGRQVDTSTPTIAPAAFRVEAAVPLESLAPVTVQAPADRVMNQQQVTPTVPPPPKPYEWPGDLPKVFAGIACTRPQATLVAIEFKVYGATDAQITDMLKVISRESGCRHWVHNYNPPTRDDSYSLCQLNALSGHFGPNGVLAGWDRWRMLDDFVYAAQGCAKMWSVCGIGPWTKPYWCVAP